MARHHRAGMRRETPPGADDERGDHRLHDSDGAGARAGRRNALADGGRVNRRHVHLNGHDDVYRAGAVFAD